MQPQNLTIAVLLTLLLLSLLSCADKPTDPELTEEDVARIVAEELACVENPSPSISRGTLGCYSRQKTILIVVAVHVLAYLCFSLYQRPKLV